MIINPDKDKYRLTKKGLFLKLQNKVPSSKGCCNNWIDCIPHSECLLAQVLWNPVRTNLSQEHFQIGRLVTTDCFFTPPNILEVVLIVDIKEDIIFTYSWKERIAATKKEGLFIFPDTELLSSFEFAIKQKYKASIYFNHDKSRRKFFEIS